MSDTTFTESELTAIRADLDACEREAAINEAATKVADAAGLEQIAENAYVRVSAIKPLDLHAIAVLGHAWDVASLATTAAVREYRALTESQERENKTNERD